MLALRKQKPILFLLMLTAISGCQSPFLVFPGGELNGTVSTAENFAFAESYHLIRLEVNPQTPYSVILRCVVIDGDLYLDAAPERKWGQMINDDPRVRVKLGDRLYEATAEPVTEASIKNRFLDGRTIFRLTPGWPVRSPTAR